MAILVRYAPPSMTAEQYDQVSRNVQEQLQWPPDGLIAHVCFGSGNQLRVSEVWDSREQLEAFQEGLLPLIADAGIDVESGEPEFFEVHAVETRERSVTV